MIGYDFGMHRAGVFLYFSLLRLGLGLVMGVLCNRYVSDRKHNCVRNYCCNVCSHFVWL
jgi:hypothetical protein